MPKVNALTPRLLAIFPGALGDFLCFLPALRILSQDRPVDLFARTEFVDLVPSTVTVYSLECRQIHRLFVPQSGQEEDLRDFFSEYLAIFSWMGSQQSTFTAELHSVSQKRARVFPFQPSSMEMHQTDYYLTCVIENPSLADTLWEIPLKPEAVAWAERYWRQHDMTDKPVLALAPGSGAQEKNWPDPFFRAVAHWWHQRTSGTVVVILGPVEEERGTPTTWPTEAVVARHLSLSQLAALLVGADFYLGNDSGVSHLAAALDVVSVVLFGPSNAQQWAPRGKHVTVLSQLVECAPCTGSMMKKCAHRRCLTMLRPESVCEELDRLLEEKLTLTRGKAGIRVISGVYQSNF